MLDCMVSLPLPRALRTGFLQHDTEARVLMLRAPCASVTEQERLLRSLRLASEQWSPPVIEVTSDWCLVADGGVVASQTPLADRPLSGLYDRVQQVIEQVLGRPPAVLARFNHLPFGTTTPSTWRASEMVIECARPGSVESYCVPIGPQRWVTDPAVEPITTAVEVEAREEAPPAPVVPPPPPPWLNPPRPAPQALPQIVEQAVVQTTHAATQPTPAPAPAPEVYVRLFERHGFLDGSVLDLGSALDAGFTRVALSEAERDRSPLQRRWRTIVVTTERERALPLLLAARGLLAPTGRVLLARPASDDGALWEQVFIGVFTAESLSIPGHRAWRLTPVASEEPMTEVASHAPPAINVVVNVPEQHLRVVAPVTNHFAAPSPPRITVHTPEIKLPQQEPPVVNVMPGAVQVDVHTPPPASKKIEVQKDPYGKLVGVLTTVPEHEPPKEHSGRLGREP